jgi:hypothetical protein
METNTKFNKDQMTPEEFNAWVEQKRDKRDALYKTAENQTHAVFESPDALNAHLKLQARFGKMGVTNTLLVGAQMPDAKELRTFDEWKDRGRSVNRGAEAIYILQQQGEYTREDGSTGRGFDAKSVFDVSQTYGKEMRNRPYPPAKAVIKAMLTKPPIRIEWSDHVADARYDQNTNTVEANRKLDADQLLYSVMREFAVADGADLFVAECAATTACYRYSLMPESFDYDFARFRNKDTRELKDMLTEAKDLACNYCEHIDKNLQKMRERKQEER